MLDTRAHTCTHTLRHLTQAATREHGSLAWTRGMACEVTCQPRLWLLRDQAMVCPLAETRVNKGIWQATRHRLLATLVLTCLVVHSVAHFKSSRGSAHVKHWTQRLLHGRWIKTKRRGLPRQAGCSESKCRSRSCILGRLTGPNGASWQGWAGTVSTGDDVPSVFPTHFLCRS